MKQGDIATADVSKPNMPSTCSSDSDIGVYINSVMHISDDVKYNVLMTHFMPTESYNFKADASGKRNFRLPWLTQYSPWLAYSPKLKGALCVYCTLFPQPVHCGYQGAFITCPFTKYKDFNECAKNHVAYACHIGATQDASTFKNVKQTPEKDIICQINRSVKNAVEENRKKLFPILSTILFCATNDLALREKNSNQGNVQQLFDFCIEAGDEILKAHLESSAPNARYTSHRTQNDLISLCEAELRKQIVATDNNSTGFSILADESADISGKEQLSIGLRFVEKGSHVNIREEFLGFTSLEDMSASAIADSIINQCQEVGLDLNKLLGQGYDGCSTMAGKDNGVQVKIRQSYPKAAFVHCASHRLNLVVNDLNAVAEVRNAVSTIKAVITFFCESYKRRSSVPNIPLLCDTRWTSKYKSIRILCENFEHLYCQLESLSMTTSGSTRQNAHQLYCSMSSATFLFYLVIISSYSALLEPVTQALQAVNLDMLKVQNHLENLLKVFRLHRQEAEQVFRADIFHNVMIMVEKLNIQLTVPCQCRRQIHRSNPGSPDVEDYFRQTLFIPYLDSLIGSLEGRFSETNSVQFNLFSLHPARIAKLDRKSFKKQMSSIHEVYKIDNFETEAMVWFDFWSSSPMQDTDIDFLDILTHTEFYPAIHEAIVILLTLPATTCTIERSFSTMRRVKTWLRATMADDRLSGLCMLSVHREKISSNKAEFMNKVVDEFGREHRRQQFLFK